LTLKGEEGGVPGLAFKQGMAFNGTEKMTILRGVRKLRIRIGRRRKHGGSRTSFIKGVNSEKKEATPNNLKEEKRYKSKERGKLDDFGREYGPHPSREFG